MTADNRTIASSAAIHRPALDALRDWDTNAPALRPSARPVRRITPADARLLAERLRAEYPEDALAGVARGDAPERVVEAIYQGFDGIDLYPTVEGKAAHLLYFTVKDHPYLDGNKRMGLLLFAAFLEANKWGAMPSDAALAALTLLVAVSDPGDKDRMIGLIMRLMRMGDGKGDV